VKRNTDDLKKYKLIFFETFFSKANAFFIFYVKTTVLSTGLYVRRK